MPQPLVSGANPAVGQALLEKQEQRIEQAFFLDKLTIPMNDRMTATEIVERRQQGLMSAAPVLARLYSEWLNPIIEFTYSYMRKKGALPEPPPELKGSGMTIEYRSPMANSKRSGESQAFLQSLQVVLPLLQANPGVFDNINADSAVRTIMAANGVNPKMLRTEEEVAMIRQQRVQQEQQAVQAQAIQQQSIAARNTAAAAKDIRDAQQQ